MSARRAYVNGRPVWLPVDEGMTPYRKATYIGGSLVMERPFSTITTTTVTPSRLAQMAEYKRRTRAAVGEYRPRNRDVCARLMPIAGSLCARAAGHSGGCVTRAAMDVKAAKKALR